MTEQPQTARSGELARGNPAAMAVALADHPFTRGLDAGHVEALAMLSGEVNIAVGQPIFRHGQPAETLYLVTKGDVALEIVRPGAAPLRLQTLHGGDVLGWSWLFPPYAWSVDAHAVSDVVALAIDGVRLREALVVDPALGCVIAMRVGASLVDRLQHARDRLAATSVV